MPARISKKIILIFVSFAILFSIFPFSVSASGSEYIGKADFFTWVSSHGGFAQVIAGNFFFGEGCSVSDDGRHHASSFVSDASTGKYDCICSLCGDRFLAYKSDLAAAYDSYVHDVQDEYGGIVFGSDGGWFVPLAVDWDSYSSQFCVISSVSSVSNFGLNFNNFTIIKPSGGGGNMFFDCELMLPDTIFPVGTFYLYPLDSSRFSYDAIDPTTEYNFKLLVGNGSSSLCQRFSKTSDGIVYPSTSVLSFSTSVPCSLTTSTSGSSDSKFSFSGFASASGVSYAFKVSIDTSHLLYFKPAFSDSFPAIIKDINSRPVSITGDYGIMGDNGQIVKVDRNTIVNETSSTVYNPVTNTTSNMTDWQYDYSTRTYTVTLDSGTTQTITYGDEHIIINEGDTVYNVYYISDGSGSSGESGGDTPAGCDHDYTSSITTAATCEAPGLRTYTCSKCGSSYTEKIPATGHTWTVKQSVATEYDDEGNVITEGYTIYKCSVCSTEYRDNAGTGPPNNSVDNGSGESLWDKLGSLIGTVGGGILDIIDAIFGKLLDALISLAEMISEKLSRVVELVLSFFEELPALFTGFMLFLTASFAYFPDDVILLLTFGIAVVIFIAIFKAWRR